MVNKILTITAALTFIFVLAVNIDMTLNDPFTTMSIEAIAADTDSGTTGNNLYDVKEGDYISPAFTVWRDCTECNNSTQEDIKWTERPVEMICEDSGNLPCTGNLYDIISIDPCIWCGYQEPY